MLADNGYDVWMGNARGSAHSRKHIRMDPDKDANFWNFSWHEIALFDVAGKVNYIRSYTKEQKLFYVGHSQGTTVYFVLNSLRPEYNDYFHAMAALAPIAFLSTKKNEHFVNHFVENGIKKLVSEVGMGELKPSKDRAFCIDLGQLSGLCSNIIHLMNFKPEEIEVDVYGRSEQTFPAGGSVKQFLHYAQEYISGRFCQYDHGSEENLKLYGNKDPPSYSIKKISSPIGIYCGVDDILSTPKNVEKLEEKLPNISNKLFLDNFTHFDFLISTDAVDLLYIPIIEEFKKINPL
ncbi:lipase 3 isoform X2 [Aethina tumida]|nr:lipase 3 isoform X2 [Aethina tumida]